MCFVLTNARKYTSKDFELKTEKFSKGRKGKRKYLEHKKQNIFFEKLDAYFKSKVKVPRIRVGRNQEIETLITEEAQLLAKYIRDKMNMEIKNWT